MEGAQARGIGGGVGVVESKMEEKPHATQEDSREGGRRWWRMDLHPISNHPLYHSPGLEGRLLRSRHLFRASSGSSYDLHPHSGPFLVF